MKFIYLWLLFPFCVEGIPKDFMKLHGKQVHAVVELIGPNSQVIKVKAIQGIELGGITQGIISDLVGLSSMLQTSLLLEMRVRFLLIGKSRFEVKGHELNSRKKTS